MSQTYIPKDINEKVTYKEFGVGGMISTYSQVVRQYEGTGSGCFGPTYVWSDRDTRKYSTYLLGLQLSHHEILSQYKRFTFRGSGFLAMDHVSSLKDDYECNEMTFGLNPYVQFDWRYFGFGAGLHLGSLRYAEIDVSGRDMAVGEWENKNDEYIFLPQLHMRLGPYDIFYIEGNIANHFPSSSPMPFYMAGIGTGLGKVNGTKIGAGISDAGYYLQAIYPFKEKYVLEAFYADRFKPSDDIQSRSESYAKRMFSFGFHYRFNFKTVPK